MKNLEHGRCQRKNEIIGFPGGVIEKAYGTDLGQYSPQLSDGSQWGEEGSGKFNSTRRRFSIPLHVLGVELWERDVTCGTEHELAHVGVCFFDNSAHERY
ncbi:hypothetical protein GW17_00053751 [Ensete ventricosum]|nr:hypothetical protein GW17_00053751 [Ensete ventricosum]